MARVFNVVFVFAIFAILATFAAGSPLQHHKASSHNVQNAPNHHQEGSGPSPVLNKENSAHPVMHSGVEKAEEPIRTGRQYGGYYPGGYGSYPYYGNYGNFGSAQASAQASASSNSFGYGK